ncbi:nucleotide exchange factor GrpE [Micromonospora sp. DT229]|uniref:nucleotide exchange factor GrpE n=1 Tax=Micromonospora sp. DT229 TaxID=3393430 RepID=UPI003CF7B826
MNVLNESEPGSTVNVSGEDPETAGTGPEPVDTDSATVDAAATGSDGLLQRLDRLDLGVQELRRELAAAHERAAAQERIIDRLHEDNQRLRAGERQLVLRPLLTDLYRLHADLLRQAASLPVDLSATRAAELLTSFAYSAELSLERGGVQVYRPAVGEQFDPSRHRATGVVPAAGPNDDGQIAEAVGVGYLDSVTGRPLALAPVRVSRWSPVEPTGADDPAGGVIPQQLSPSAD